MSKVNVKLLILCLDLPNLSRNGKNFFWPKLLKSRLLRFSFICRCHYSFQFQIYLLKKKLFVADIIEWDMVTDFLEIMKCFSSVHNVLSLRELITDWRCPSVQFLDFLGCKKPEWNLWCLEKNRIGGGGGGGFAGLARRRI